MVSFVEFKCIPKAASRVRFLLIYSDFESFRALELSQCLYFFFYQSFWLASQGSFCLCFWVLKEC
jgi:hypothetical protein